MSAEGAAAPGRAGQAAGRPVAAGGPAAGEPAPAPVASGSAGERAGGASARGGGAAPRVASGAAAQRAGSASAPGGARLGTVLRGLRSIGIQIIVTYLLERGLEEAERRRVDDLYARNVDPEVQRRLEASTAAIDRLTDGDPYRPLYANVTLHLEEAVTAVNGGPSTHVSGVSVTALAVSPEQRSGTRLLREAPQTVSAHFVRVLRSSEVRYATRIELNRPPGDRAETSVRDAVTAGRPLREVLGGRQWTDAETDEFIQAYTRAAAGNEPLLAGAREVSLERARSATLTLSYGRATVQAAQASAESGLSSRASAAHTHWAAPADRLRFARAYAELTRAPSRFEPLHADAVRYRDELVNAELEPLRRYLQSSGR